MARDETVVKVNRIRRNLFKAGSAGVAGVALLFGLGANKASASICYLKGTRITTVDGELPVEELAVGSRLPTMFGGVQAIQLVRKQVVRKIAGSRWHQGQMLVKIQQGALAPNVPHADLFVTQAHAIHVDGVLASAINFVNGTTVTLFAPDCDEYEIYHFKLESHDVVRAEGAPCESLRETAADEACLPVLSFNGNKSEIRSRLRSALSPLVDRREKTDILRDYLEEHGVFEARPFSN
jgi:hypothetical protein